MQKLSHYILTIALPLIILSCGEKNTSYIDKEFEGYWADSGWHYDFDKDGTFTFKSDGHFGFTTQTGKYAIIDDVIVLVPNSDWVSRHGVLKERLKIFSEDCIRDFDNNFYCQDIEKVFSLRDREFEFQDSVVMILDSLSVAIDEKRRVNFRRAEGEKLDLKIGFEQVFVVDQEEYYVFSLFGTRELPSTEFERYSFLSFLVKKQPFEIYQHHSSGDSLSLVYN